MHAFDTHHLTSSICSLTACLFVFINFWFVILFCTNRCCLSVVESSMSILSAKITPVVKLAFLAKLREPFIKWNTQLPCSWMLWWSTTLVVSAPIFIGSGVYHSVLEKHGPSLLEYNSPITLRVSLHMSAKFMVILVDIVPGVNCSCSLNYMIVLN